MVWRGRTILSVNFCKDGLEGKFEHDHVEFKAEMEVEEVGG